MTTSDQEKMMESKETSKRKREDTDDATSKVAKKDKKKKKKSKKMKKEEQEEKKVETTTLSTTIGQEKEDKKKLKKEKKKKKKKSKDNDEKKDKSTTSQTSPATSSTSDNNSELNLEETKKWRLSQRVVLKDTEASDEKLKYIPYTSFSSPRIKSTIHETLLQQCTQVNKFQKPSPIQAQCWPVLMSENEKGVKRDVVGIAETGSGKTLAFALPALTSMVNEDENKNKKQKKNLPRMLVLAPTRELAMQSHKILTEYGEIVSLQSLCVFGGVPKDEQRRSLRKGECDCIVATPGRMKDLIEEGTCDLSCVSYLVLDEADRMLDMGFEEDVRFIISQCKPKTDGRQTTMFSATWPAAIQDLAMEFMVNPLRVYVGFEAIVGSNGENNVDDSLSANKRVKQIVEVIDDFKREGRLRELLDKYGSKNKRGGGGDVSRILIFALYKKEAARLEMNLRRRGWEGAVASIHGDKAQGARTEALQSFKDGKCPLLVATDVAARGLDIPNVEVVINYTFPLTIEDYIHRIGRTGRAGKTGISYTLFQATDKSHAGELQQVLKQAGQDVPEELMKFGSTIKKKEHKLYGNFGPKSGPMKKAQKITFDSDSE